jgi:signal transduction histidine kinase
VLIRGEDGGRAVTVRVENDAAPPAADGSTPSDRIPGTGRGRLGLRERVLASGGSFVAGPASRGGWTVEAHLAR